MRIWRARPPRACTIAAITILGLGELLFPSDACADEPRATRVRVSEKSRITGLEWPKNAELEVKTEYFGEGGYKTTALLVGKFTKPKSTLLWDSTRVKVAEDGEFKLEVPIQGDSTLVQINAVDIRGDIQPEPTRIKFAGYRAYLIGLRAKPTKRNFLSGGVGMSWLAYSEGSKPDYSSLSMTGKISYLRQVFPPNWDFSASAYLTLLPITKSVAPTARFLGLNVRVGYAIPRIESPWHLAIHAGGYYTTMFVSDNGFGFKNIGGPQLYPTLRRTFKKGDALAGYLKFSPISANFSLLALSNRELGGGISYSRPFRNGHSLACTLDASNLAFAISGIEVSSNSVTLGASYGL